MSVPPLEMNDGESGSFRVPVISCNTAFFCLERICGSVATRAQSELVEAADDNVQGVLTVDRLIAIARKSGFQLQAANFDWRALLIATATQAVLLLLRNGNVIAALDTGRDGVEEIVVCDPLYQNGDPFFLPRVALEHAWGGDALVIKPKRGKTERALTWYLSILSLCGIAAAILLVFQNTIGLTAASFDTPHENSAAIAANLSAGQAALDETPAAATVTAADTPPGADAAADTANVPEANIVTSPAAEPVQTEQSGAAVGDGAATSAEAGAGAAPEPPAEPNAPPATPSAPAAEQIAALPAPAPSSGLSTEEIAVLIARGDALIIKGDLASARLFYERAADATDGQAALRLGESYDPVFLARVHLSGARGDTQTAARWYRRARQLGIGEADALLRTLSPK